MSTAKDRRVAIMEELLALTKKMVGSREEYEALVQGVEDRQTLIEEYDKLDADPASSPLAPQDLQTVKDLAVEILEKDKVVTKAMESMRTEAKADIASNNQQQRVLQYMNNAISTSGSYMDYKK